MPSPGFWSLVSGFWLGKAKKRSRFKCSSSRIARGSLWLILSLASGLSCTLNKGNESKFNFIVTACEGPMQESVEVSVARKDGKIIQLGKTDASCSVSISKSKFEGQIAALLCKEGFECVALPIFDFGFENPNDTYTLDNKFEEYGINLPQKTPEIDRMEDPSDVFSIKVNGCGSDNGTVVYGMKMFLMQKDGKIIYVDTIPAGNMQDFKIYKDAFYDAKIIFLCGPSYYCSATLIETPGFFEKNKLIISMAPFVFF